MRSKLHIWGVTGVLFVATCIQVAAIYLRLPETSRTAPVQWSLLGVWLLIPPLAIWRQFNEHSDPTTAAVHAGVRLAVVGYVGIMIVLWLMHRVLT